MLVYGGMHPRENLENEAIWCVLEYILIRFYLKIFPKITIFILKIMTLPARLL